MTVSSDLAPDDPFMKLLDLFFAELAFLGRTCQRWSSAEPGGRALITRYVEQREIPLRAMVAMMEEECGLRFTGMRLPYRHNSATWPPDHAMAGYTDKAPVPSPSQWLASVFSNWRTLAHESSSMSEIGTVFRSALWVCQHSGVDAALRFVVDLVDTGQVLDVRAAAWATSRIAIGGSLADEPEGIVSRLVEGGAPTDSPGWLFLVPSEECWREPARPSSVVARALESLIAHGWTLVDRARAATTLDDWLPLTVGLDGTLRFIADVVTLTLGEVPTEVAAILSQFEELWCDVSVAVTNLEIAENGGTGAGVAGMVAYERGLQQRFQSAGDDSGLRFQRERLLLPPSVLADGETADWVRPSWRVGLPWVMASVLGDPSEFVPEMGAAYRHFQHQETGPARALLHGVLDSYRFNDAAHWLLAKTYETDGDHHAVLDSVLPVLFLRPDQHEGWDVLGQALDARGHQTSAALALRMYTFSLRRAANRAPSADPST